MIMNISSFYDNDQHQSDNLIDHECEQCSKRFACNYGLHYHRKMSHPNQSIFCSDCHLIFRSHRALKTHQQRFHFIYSDHLPNYNHISSYLIVPFSTPQFSFMATTATEQGRFPLGELSSKFFPCQLCELAFPTLNAWNFHRLNQHEQYEYQLCQTIIYEIICQVEENLRTVNDEEEFSTMKYLLAKQASQFGLRDKQLARRTREMKSEQHRRIFPFCEHRNRTCANLCLQNLSSYHQIIQNYPYQISTVPKGSPFTQGSIVSNPLMNSKESLHPNVKRMKSSPSPKKSLLKINHTYTRSLSSMSSTSSTSTRSSSKTSRQSWFKRSVSPTMTLAVERSSEKRRRQREKRKANGLSSSSSKIHDDIEQENDEDELLSIKSKKPKQRQASNSSVEYVQVINTDQSSISSLNNIENIKSKTSSNDEDDIIVCQSSPTKSSMNGVHKIHNSQPSDYDEHVRVRCKICGEILDGRSRFSKHVLTMHSHLLKSNLSDIKKQQSNTIVYSV